MDWMELSGPRREGRAHLETKRIIERMVAPGPLIVSAEVDDRFRSYRFVTAGMTPVIECAYPSGEQVLDVSRYYAAHGEYPEMIFDLGLKRDGEVIAAIEVIRSHGLDARKRRKIIQAGILCLCVKASHWEWKVDDQRIDVCEILGTPWRRSMLEPIRIGAVA